MENLEDIELCLMDDRISLQCPMCGGADLERRGHKDICPKCFYVQPCCGGGE